MPTTVFYVMRHGLTDYVQGNEPVSMSLANDLTPEGILKVQASAQDLCSSILQHRMGNQPVAVQIVSSPTGRCLHTSRLVADVLRASNGGVECAPIVPEAGLIEVQGFVGTLYQECLNAHEAQLRALVHQHCSPGLPDWQLAVFPLDLLHQLPMAGLAPHLGTFIHNMETAASAHARLREVATCYCTPAATAVHVLVTHDGLPCKWISQVTGNAVHTLERGHWVRVGCNEGGNWQMLDTNMEALRGHVNGPGP